MVEKREVPFITLVGSHLGHGKKNEKKWIFLEEMKENKGAGF